MTDTTLLDLPYFIRLFLAEVLKELRINVVAPDVTNTK